MTDIILAGVLIHLFVDWFLQTDWMAQNKMKWAGYWPHPAGIVHAGLHGLFMLLVFPPLAALLVAVLHWALDMRVPLIWWRKALRQTTDPNNPAALHVAIWQDQVAHVLVITAVALLLV